MNAYKDMLDNVVSPITSVSMNHQNQLEQMENGAMFATEQDQGHVFLNIDSDRCTPRYIRTVGRLVVMYVFVP
jgi:hypothetical protein